MISAKDIALRGVAVLLWVIAIYGILGGEFVYREGTQDGGTKTSTITM